MPKLIYAPKALEDLQGIKTYITTQFGANKANYIFYRFCLGLAVFLMKAKNIGTKVNGKVFYSLFTDIKI